MSFAWYVNISLVVSVPEVQPFSFYGTNDSPRLTLLPAVLKAINKMRTC